MQPFSQRFLEVYDALVHSHLGLVRRVIDLPLQADEARLFIAAATCNDPLYFHANKHTAVTNYRVLANGIGFTREECLWSVLGEACERYASGICFPEDYLIATWDEVRTSAVPLDQFILFDAEQYAQPAFPWLPLDPKAPMRWGQGFSLINKSPRLVPAFLAWMGYTPQLEGERFLPQVSTGQGAGGTLEQAILAGLNEVIERDSFSCAWLLAHANFRLDNKSLHATLDPGSSSLLELPGLDALVFDIATDLGVSCYLAVLKAQRRNTIAIGASANLSPHAALTKALMEAHHTRNWTLELEREGESIPAAGISDFKHHVLHYLDPDSFSKLAFLMSAPAAVLDAHRDDSSIPERLAATVASLAEAGFDPVYIDTTPDDLRSIGVSTAKVVVPGLQPLHVGMGTEHRDPRRLKRVAQHWGLPWPKALNSEPHPFP